MCHFSKKNVISSTRISLKAFHIVIYLSKGSRPLTGSCWGGTASSTGAFTWFGSYGIVWCLKMSASLQVPHPHPLVQSQKLNINSPCEPCLKAIQPSSPKKHLATKNTPPIFLHETFPFRETASYSSTLLPPRGKTRYPGIHGKGDFYVKCPCSRPLPDSTILPRAVETLAGGAEEGVWQSIGLALDWVLIFFGKSLSVSKFFHLGGCRRRWGQCSGPRWTPWYITAHVGLIHKFLTYYLGDVKFSGRKIRHIVVT